MDAFLKRFERDAGIACAVMAFVALVWPGGGVFGALSVLAGGALSWGSYRSLKGGLDGALAGGRRGAWALVNFFTRYAILAFVAYVMLARLRLHPLGLIAGVSSLVAAVMVAAVRAVATTSRTPR